MRTSKWILRAKPPLGDLARDAHLGIGGFAKMGVVKPRSGEGTKALAQRITRHAGLAPMAAKTVAAQLLGETGLAEAQAMVQTAQSLGRRDDKQLQIDPTSVRGFSADLQTPESLARLRPSLALTVGALRSLRFDQGATADDLALFWMLFAFAAAGHNQLSSSRIYKILNWVPSRFDFAARSLRVRKWSLQLDNSVPAKEWVKTRPVIQELLTTGTGNLVFSIDPLLVQISRPTARGVAYAHLDLAAVVTMRDRHEEQLFRSMLAAATNSKIWRWHGGRLFWSLRPRDIAEITGRVGENTSSIIDLSIKPMVTRLRESDCRLTIAGIEKSRAETQRGRPIERITLEVAVAVARSEERPFRTAEDDALFPITPEIANLMESFLEGTGRKDLDAEKRDRSLQARQRGIAMRIKRVERAPKLKNESQPRLSSPDLSLHAPIDKPEPVVSPDDPESIEQYMCWVGECISNEAERSELVRRETISLKCGLNLMSPPFASVDLDLIVRYCAIEERIKTSARRDLFYEDSPGISLFEEQTIHPQATLAAIADEWYEEHRFGNPFVEVHDPLTINEKCFDQENNPIYSQQDFENESDDLSELHADHLRWEVRSKHEQY